MEELFQKYTDAFDCLDANKIADLYTLPCSTADGDGVNVFTSREALLAKFTKNCKSMSERGYIHSKFNIIDIVEMDEASKTVIIGWRVYLRSAELEFRALYVCHKSNESWRVFSANVYAGDFGITEQ